MSGERLNVFATRMTLTTMKNRSKGAKAGHKLLKRKADALTMKFRSMAKIIKDVRDSPRALPAVRPPGRPPLGLEWCRGSGCYASSNAARAGRLPGLQPLPLLTPSGPAVCQARAARAP